MKTHTNNFKNELALFGRQFNDILTYNSEVLSSEDIKGINFSFKSSLMKTVMKQLTINTTVEMAKGDTINYQLGLNINGTYEYLDYGNFIVEKVEKQEDKRSWLVTCYDKMLLTMVDYVSLKEYQLTEDTEFADDKTYYELSDDEYIEYDGDRTGNPSQLNLYETISIYPITIRDYIGKICNHFNITFANESSTFINYDKEIPSELYLDEEEKTLGYTFRDVLDELAQVTGSFIVINDDDELELKYINQTNDTINENYFNDVNVNIGKKYGPINSLVFSRSAGSDNIAVSNNQSIESNGLCEVKISDNQILNDNNRGDYLQDLFNYLDGLYYYLNDYDLKGVLYYEVGDIYNVSIFGNTYQCLMLNDEINRNPGVKETIYSEEPETSVSDYKAASETDKTINKAYLIVNKQEGKIEGLVSKTNSIDTTVNNNYQELNSKFDDYTPVSRTVEIENSVTTLQTETYTKTQIDTKLIDGSVQKVMTASGTFDIDGMHYEKTNAPTSTTINEVGVGVKKTNDSEYVLFAGYVDSSNTQYSDFEGQTIVATENMLVKNYMVVGNNSRFENYEDGTGCFYIGG